MDIIEFRERQDISENVKLNRIYTQFGGLLKELRKRELSPGVMESINQEIRELNSSILTGNKFRKLIKQAQTKTLKRVENELKIVPRNYYRGLWLAFGMSLGLLIGLAFAISVSNTGLLAIGLPFGIIIGIAVGSGMDKKALEEGRQLNIEIKY